MADFENQALPFQIRVIEGALSQTALQDGQPPGVIQLVGAASPLRPLKMGGTMRVKTSFYPGNPRASQQPIGATEKPTTVTGEWNDVQLGSDGAAFALMRLIDDVRLSGLSVEVSWVGGLSGDASAPELTGDPIVRVGLITSTDFTIQRVQDVQWEVEFTWRSRGDTATPMIASTAQLNPREGFANVNAELEAAIALWRATRQGPQVKDIGLAQVIDDAMDAIFDRIETVTGVIEDAASTVTSAVVIPASTAQQLIGACAEGVDAAQAGVDTILSINRVLLEVKDDAIDLLEQVDQLSDSILQLDAAGEACVDAGNGIGANVEPDVIAEVTAPAGTDLRDLAIRYYGDPDLYWLIANYNGIDGSAVPSPPAGASDDPARPIKIPRAGSGTSSDLSQQC